MEQGLVATGQRRANTFALGRFAPVGSSCDSAVVSGKADQHRLAAVPLACQLTDIQLAALAHLGGACVAEVGIMLPDGNFRAATFPTEMGSQRIERFEHVAVAQIP